MILTLSSTNPKLSWVINKHPEKVQLKTKDSGYFVSFFEGEQKFVTVFKDSSIFNSYKVHVDESNNYVNTSRFYDARIISDAMKNLFNEVIKKKSENDLPAFHSIEISALETQNKTIDIFSKYFKEDYEILYNEKKNYYSSVVIKTKKEKTLHDFLQLVNLFSITSTLNSKNYIYIDDSLVEKYVKMAVRLDVPYFVRYLMKIYFFTSEVKNQKFLGLLAESNNFKFNFQPGNTHNARIKFVLDKIKGQYPILDIGVGIDYQYLRRIAKIPKVLYYGIEKDEEALFKIKRYIKNEKLEERCFIFESIEEFLASDYTNKKFDIICTEVLEHNSLEEVSVILQQMKSLDFNKIVLTVPNGTFNQFYSMNSEFRHSDHKWEVSQIEFFEIVSKEFLEINLESFGVGDSVNDIFVSNGIVLSKN